MVRLRSRSSGVVVVVDDATAAQLAGFDVVLSKDEKPETKRRAPAKTKK